MKADLIAKTACKTKCVLPITVTIVITMIILDDDWLTWAKLKVTSSD